MIIALTAARLVLASDRRGPDVRGQLHPPGSGTVQYNGPIAVDETGQVWLAVQVRKPGGFNAPLPTPVVIRFTIATGATAAFPVPQACQDFSDSQEVPVATSEGSV